MAPYTETAAWHDGDVDLERDDELVRRCQAGDPAAFAELYERYAARLTRFCLRRLHDHQEAEDVAQEAFVKAWRALPRFAGARRFYPWLTVIAGNQCTDVLRRRSRSAPVVDVDHVGIRGDLVDSGPTAEEQIVAATDGELVARALGRLNPRHRRVLELREGSEWSYRKIARFEGVEVGTVETLVWRARQALRREFEALADQRPALGAVAFVGTGAGALRRLRATVVRYAAHLRPGDLRLRDAAATLVVTSALATSAALPSAAPVGTSGRPPVDRPTSPAPAAAPGTHTLRATGAPGPGGTPGRDGGPPVAATTGGSPGTGAPYRGAPSGAGADRPSAGTVSPAPTPAVLPPGLASPVGLVAPVTAPVVGAVPAVTSVVGTAVPATGPLPVATGAGAVAGAIVPVTGSLPSAVPAPGGAAATSDPVGGLVGSP